jgi:Zn-dependent protease/predicted transcriptional regulator
MDAKTSSDRGPHQTGKPRFGQIPLFSLFGFKVKLDFSWLLLGLLITWTLAMGMFPFSYPHLGTSTYWWMGLAGAFGVLFSIIFHEFSHSLVARHYGLPIGGITLFIFGGVAEMEQEPANPKTEFLMAVAGPLASVFLAAVFYLIETLATASQWPTAVIGVTHYMAVINLVLAVFNLVPAFPLDGGRMLRALLWRWKRNLKSATRIASQVGSGFGVVLMVLGVLAFIQGNFIGGMWWLLIGAFLRAAASASYRQLLVRETLKGHPVSKFMQRNPVSVAPSLSIRELVEDYIYQYYFKLFPVVEDGKLRGCITTDVVKQISKQDWDQKKVGDFTEKCSQQNSVSPDQDASTLMTGMFKPGGATRFMVVEDNKLVGVISLKDLREMIALRFELEED